MWIIYNLKIKRKNERNELVMEKLNYSQKGITLIALVITIIVLLILAGISIAMLTGKNGILAQKMQSQKQIILKKMN